MLNLRTDYMVVNPEDRISQYLDDLLEDKVIVVKDLVIEGILTKRAFLRSRLDPSQTKVKYFIEKTHIASPKEIEEEEDKVMKLMIENKWRFILVGNKTDVKGYLKREDFIEKYSDLLKDKKVKNYYNKNLITILDSEPISKALHIMKFNNIDRLVVLDEDHNLVGIITLTDILKEVFKPMERLQKGSIAPEKIHELRRPVRELMSDNPLVIKPSQSLLEVFNLLKENNINSLIVVKENDPTTAIGIITMFDLFLYIYQNVKSEEEIEINISLQKVQLDEFDLEWIKNKFKSLLRKYKKYFENSSVFIDIKKYKERLEEYHETDFYHVRVHLYHPGKKIIIEAKDDNLYGAIHRALKRLDKQLLKLKEKYSEKEVYEILQELAERF
jgi:ribosomal subunit interface protein